MLLSENTHSRRREQQVQIAWNSAWHTEGILQHVFSEKEKIIGLMKVSFST